MASMERAECAGVPRDLRHGSRRHPTEVVGERSSRSSIERRSVWDGNYTTACVRRWPESPSSPQSPPPCFKSASAPPICITASTKATSICRPNVQAPRTLSACSPAWATASTVTRAGPTVTRICSRPTAAVRTALPATLTSTTALPETRTFNSKRRPAAPLLASSGFAQGVPRAACEKKRQPPTRGLKHTERCRQRLDWGKGGS